MVLRILNLCRKNNEIFGNILFSSRHQLPKAAVLWIRIRSGQHHFAGYGSGSASRAWWSGSKLGSDLFYQLNNTFLKKISIYCVNKSKVLLLISNMCKNLGRDPDPDLDRHQNEKSDPDRNQHDADPQHYKTAPGFPFLSLFFKLI